MEIFFELKSDVALLLPLLLFVAAVVLPSSVHAWILRKIRSIFIAKPSFVRERVGLFEYHRRMVFSMC